VTWPWYWVVLGCSRGGKEAAGDVALENASGGTVLRNGGRFFRCWGYGRDLLEDGEGGFSWFEEVAPFGELFLL
jgi:hypothetical protein